MYTRDGRALVCCRFRRCGHVYTKLRWWIRECCRDGTVWRRASVFVPWGFQYPGLEMTRKNPALLMVVNLAMLCHVVDVFVAVMNL